MNIHNNDKLVFKELYVGKTVSSRNHTSFQSSTFQWFNYYSVFNVFSQQKASNYLGKPAVLSFSSIC